MASPRQRAALTASSVEEVGGVVRGGRGCGQGRKGVWS